MPGTRIHKEERSQKNAVTKNDNPREDIARRYCKCCAQQREERSPFHDSCKHNPSLGFTNALRKVGEPGQVRKRNPEELS